MEPDTAQAIVKVTCAAHDAAEPVRHYLESEADALLRTLRFWVFKAGLARGPDVAIQALEILSQVTVEALKAADRFDTSRSSKAWLLGIAAKVIKRLQKEHAELAGGEISASRLRVDVREKDEDIFDRLVALVPTSAEDAAVISVASKALLALVSPDDQRVLILAVVCSLDCEQLGKELGISPGAARARKARALTRLRRAYHEREVRNGQE
jgi:RNA polymerase sigma factor (sigma-70 family)